ncbi:agglutinin-like protein 5 [Anneissia japonica]|uniref:agglutinin-like protein 5 n=1 Tax=Anneissia japonica TaxID=1529436 RepID=UPI001425882F|nr:agglutinin-like protein 5 [Anneissia japonica]
MPEVYLSSESLELQASLESLSRSSEERCEYEGDFDDCETDSTATGFDIPSICSSPCQSTHDLSLLSNDDLLDQGDLDYWEDVTYNFVASNESHDTHVASDDTDIQMMSPAIANMSPNFSLDNELEGQEHSWKKSEVCFSNKSSIAVLPKDTSQNSSTDSDNNEEDKAVAQVSPIASDDINNQNMSLTAQPQSSVVSEDTDSQTMGATATSFHFTKEEPTTISDTSSITEEIESSISENESFATVDLTTIQPITDNIRFEDATSLEEVEYIISTNKKGSSEETFQDESSISSSESPITEDSSVADNNLNGIVDYWENAEVCFSNKSSLAALPNYPSQISSTDSDNKEEDKAFAQKSPIASDDIKKQNIFPIAPLDSAAGCEDTQNQKMEPTATPFHFSKEEATSASEKSFIIEEIECSISENELSTTLDLMEIQTDN